GLIVSAGMEDCLRMERGVQTYLGYSYADRVHVTTHHHNLPLVPRERIFGVRGRIDQFGAEAIPLYEDEVRAAAAALLGQRVEAIVVCLLFSCQNAVHEQRVREIIGEVAQASAESMQVYLSGELYPVRRETARLNTTLIEAYAAEPSRVSLKKVREKSRELGATFDLRVMASHGGTISMDAKELARTLTSGPIGGVIGAKYLSRELGVKNIACSDIGGTSFDLALITDGSFAIKQNPDMARFVLSMPLVRIDSVGAGTGSFVRVHPTSTRLEIGPDSAGSRIGTSWPDGGVDTVTITDCNVVLGYLNPDFFLGGEIRLDRARAVDAVRRQVAEPLGIDVYRAAAGVLEVFEDNLSSNLRASILGKGYGPEDFTLLSYGGGGPLHVAGYSCGMAFDDILVPAWAPGFSAFGCACGDFEYRYDKSLDLPLFPGDPPQLRAAVGQAIGAAWDVLRRQVLDEFAKNGFDADSVRFRPGVRMLYRGQLNDLEIAAPTARLESEADLRALGDAFEALYGRLYGLAARTPEVGYIVTAAIMAGVVDVEKPRLPDEAVCGEAIDPAALKTPRPIYWKGQWLDAQIVDLTALRAGNRVVGPAVVESPSSTMLVPPGRSAWLDAHRIFHLSTTA
ncbi:MAG: hydantoinase/oxoprolinase family protein, partial [Deltaproteobacteria bacterium]|nr:hydantoinase/oxoprolinase family protein [Deltaproteobacteria bacterium]